MLESLKAGPAHIKKMTIVHACGPYGNDCSQSILANPPASRSVLLPPRCNFERSELACQPRPATLPAGGLHAAGRRRRDGYTGLPCCVAHGVRGRV